MERCMSRQRRINRRVFFAARFAWPYLGCWLTIHRICHIHSAREGSFASFGSTSTETEADDWVVLSEFAEPAFLSFSNVPPESTLDSTRTYRGLGLPIALRRPE